MHSYQHNIKTFNNATRHLTRVERALYRDLIELYYDTEQPLPAADFDRLARRVLAHSDEEKQSLLFVLGEFFVLTGDVYTHHYCDEVIEKFHDATSLKAKAGAASAASRKAKAEAREAVRKGGSKQEVNTCSTGVEHSSTPVHNQKPETINQKPEKKQQGASATRLPADWQLSSAELDWTRQNFPHIDALGESERFRDYWIAQGGQRGRKTDWPATWRNWCRNARGSPPQRQQAAPQSKQMQGLSAILGIPNENSNGSRVVLDINPAGLGTDLRTEPKRLACG